MGFLLNVLDQWEMPSRPHVEVARAEPVVMRLTAAEALDRADGDTDRAADMLCVHAPRGCCHCRFSVQREALRRV